MKMWLCGHLKGSRIDFIQADGTIQKKYWGASASPYLHPSCSRLPFYAALYTLKLRMKLPCHSYPFLQALVRMGGCLQWNTWQQIKNQGFSSPDFFLIFHFFGQVCSYPKKVLKSGKIEVFVLATVKIKIVNYFLKIIFKMVIKNTVINKTFYRIIFLRKSSSLPTKIRFQSNDYSNSVSTAWVLWNDERKSNVLYYVYRNCHIKIELVVPSNRDYFCYSKMRVSPLLFEIANGISWQQSLYLVNCHIFLAIKQETKQRLHGLTQYWWQWQTLPRNAWWNHLDKQLK